MQDSAEQYKSNRYQRTSEIESMLIHGLSFEERARKEAEFGLKAANVQLNPGERILDLASGVAEHAHTMRDSTGADVDVREISPTLVGQALEKEAIRGATEKTRGALNIALGDMGNLSQNLPEDARYRLVTIFGSSFMYLKTKEDHEKALKDYYDRLLPGGKLVLQFRERIKPADAKVAAEWEKELGVRYEQKVAEGPQGKFGKFAKPGEKVHTLYDSGKGDGFYFYSALPEAKEGLTPVTNDDGSTKHYIDSDGVRHSSFGRAYITPEGEEEDLGKTQIIDYMATSAFPTLKTMLEKAGFKNVELKEEPLSPDGGVAMFAVVGEKG